MGEQKHHRRRGDHGLRLGRRNLAGLHLHRLHNCLIVGNEANGVDAGDDAGGHGNHVKGTSELINCTIANNHADGKYGGVANVDNNSNTDVRNCIIWGNTDDDGTSDDIDAQVFYASGTLAADDVDNNIIDHLGSDTRFTTTMPNGTEVNKDDDPVFADTGTNAVWTVSSYDADSGTTTFTVASISGNATPNDLFFKPDSTVPQRV